MLLKNKRIFIVEDNLENRAIMQMLLERAGAATAIDRWGRDTCQRMKDFAPVDLVLLDLMFPSDVTGYDVYDAIRAVPEFKRTPIVAVSAADPATEIPKTHARGFAGFISKPVSFRDFTNHIAVLLQGEPVWQSK